MAEPKTTLIPGGALSGAFISWAGALTLTDWLAIGGFLIALASFAVNTW